MIEQDWLQNKGKEVGANIYTTKPFDPEELFDTAAEKLGLPIS